MLLVSMVMMDVSAIDQDQETSVPQYSGTVFDSESRDPLVFATVAVEGTHIATVSNSDGEFILKVPEQHAGKNLVVSFIGYEKKSIPLSALNAEGNDIPLDMTTVSLVEVSVFPSDPDLLIRAVMNRRDQNYLDVPTSKTAFYRETIKKGWSYVSLTEAVVDIYKHPYNSSRSDQAKLIIGRKSTDYGKIDTLVFRLQGGPVSALMLDIMKDPYTLFDEEMVDYYVFEMSNITRVDDRMLYVLSFKQKPDVNTPLFYGKLYVDTESLAITSASFNMNISNRSEAARMFIRRKPMGARVFPTETAYMVNYREQDGKWFFSYARAEISFRVNWRRKLFNTNYHTTMEMAVTDWEVTDDRPYRSSDRLKMNVIMEDAVQGFADDAFWGDYNVIEPEQPIENAIRKIQKSIED
ncbi:carboxypeptidase-like regulatory domain-containing protein [Geofilum rubicundum]|uniref:Outer membrane protein n=1 Tax=Geofilum rubicundum JCM 15548 TaxID=1236989 RepID=A0A0E9LRW6_9BACT|nr:carboxypeptidase-like regulatory domain-containing protein [Geofilum rubicundum]GAO27871.1 outer membrane protein [Geofilum rubicundum JCM 15548]